MSNKLEYIVNKINRTKHDSPELEKVKDILIKNYTLKVSQLDNVVWDKIREYDFKNEVIRNCVFIEKIKLIKDMLPNVKKVERHMYAPEMNQIHFYGNYSVSAPNCVQIEGDVSIKNQLINPNALNVRNALLRKELDILKKIHGEVMARRAKRMERAKARAEAKEAEAKKEYAENLDNALTYFYECLHSDRPETASIEDAAYFYGVDVDDLAHALI